MVFRSSAIKDKKLKGSVEVLVQGQFNEKGVALVRYNGPTLRIMKEVVKERERP